MYRTISLLALLVGAAVSLTTLPDARHLRLVDSAPAKDAVVTSMPDQLQLKYNQEVRLPVSRVSLKFGGSTVQLPAVVADSTNNKAFFVAVPDSAKQGSGTYSVLWATAGDDEHVVKGSYDFTVK